MTDNNELAASTGDTTSTDASNDSTSPGAAPPNALRSTDLGRRMLDAHLGSAFAGLAVLFVVIKVLAVSRGDTTTALAIVAEGGTTSLVVGGLIWALGPILLTLLVVMMWLRARPDVAGSTPPSVRVSGMTLACVGALVSPAFVGVGIIVGAWLTFDMPGGARLFQRLGRRGSERRWRPIKQAFSGLDEEQRRKEALVAEIEGVRAQVQELRAEPLVESPELLSRLRTLDEVSENVERRWREVREREERLKASVEQVLASAEGKVAQQTLRVRKLAVGGVVALGLGSLFILLNDRPWLPAERLGVTGQASFTAYVLSADSEELVALDAGSRRLVRVAGAALVSRQFCQVRGGFLSGLAGSLAFRPLLTVYKSPPSYPMCQDLGP